MEMPKWLKWVLGVVVFIAATVGAVWLAGFFFFAFSKTNPFGKTDFSTWWTYWQFYQADPVIAKRLKVSGIVAAVVAYGAPIVALIAAMREVRSLHGEARFANAGEIEKAGLFGNTGIIIGKLKNRFLMFAGMQFVLLAAPTRSGKGVGIVVPNLLNYSESAVVLDVKLENFLITSKFRAKHGQEVFLFNPFSKDGQTHRYNPLGYISDDPRQRVTEILAIGYALYPGGGKDTFFDDAARNLFLGLCLYLCETPALPRTIGELLRQSSGKGQPIKKYLQDLITARNFREETTIDDDGEEVVTLVPIEQWDGEGLPPLSMECVDALNRFTSTSDNTLSSILASFNVPLTIWVSPLVDAATAANDFDVRDVRKKRMTIYIGIPANKLAEAELLINLFFSQLINLNTDDLLHSKPELKYSCLLLMDEFAAPGRIGIIDKANAYMAGYGLRLLTIIQSPGQIEAEPRKGYGRESARTLITNHACQIIYTPREQKDANEYSEMLGTYTFKAKGLSRQLGGKAAGGRSESESDQKRALLMPQELKEMSQRQQIINLENTKPIKCEKIAYFQDHVFIDRLKSVAPSLAKLGKKLPTKKQLEDSWGSGECAVDVPYLNLDLHEAVVQARTRELKPADVAKGIDLRTLALDFSKVPLPEGAGIEPEQVEAFVDGFFDALDAANSYDDSEAPEVDEDGASERPSDDELAALDAQAADDDGQEVAVNSIEPADDEPADELVTNASRPGGASVAKPEPHAEPEPEPDHGLGHDQADIEPDGPTDEDLAAMMEDFTPPDDGMMDEADMLAALDEMEAVPEYVEEAENDAPILDLSVLDKPLPSIKNAE